MTEAIRKNDELTTGDWVMAVVAFLLPVVLPFILAAYNLIRGNKKRAVLYALVLLLQVVVGFVIRAGR